MTKLEEVIQRGTLAARPAATAVPVGTLYETTNETPPTVYRSNGSTWDTYATYNTATGTGTVTSVAMTVPPELAVGGSPITGAGTLALTKANQSANQVWAGPTSGGAAAPAFRALVAADLPQRGSMYATKTGAGTLYAAYADGDVNALFPFSTTTTSPDNMCTASFNRARGVLFRLPRALAVTDAYIPGGSNSSTGSMWKLGIYKASDNSLVWASSAFDTVANDWYNMTGLSFTLDAETDYYFFTLATASSAAVSIRVITTIGATMMYNANSPLNASSGQGYSRLVEYTVATPGTLDATMPTLAGVSASSAQCAAVILKGSAT